MKKFGFTMAEVLITLGIIGVVASLTMPILIQKHKEQVITNKLKKFYSTFSQAYLMAVSENGTMDNWGLTNSKMVEDEEGNSDHSDESYANYEKFFNIMGKYMKIVKYEKREGGGVSAYLADGSEIVGMWLSRAENCNGNNQCGDFYVRVSGKPVGKGVKLATLTNVFCFLIYPNKIVPHGTGANFNYCKNGTNYPVCTAWVLYNGNMDYLHCPDELSWDGKTKCK